MRRQPVPSDYGLSEYFDAADYMAEAEWLTERATRQTSRFVGSVVAAIIALPIVGFVVITNTDLPIAEYARAQAETGTAYVLLWFWFLFAPALLVDPIRNLAHRLFAPELDDRAETYIPDFDAWQSYREHVALNFWKKKRGVELERALMKMLSSPGCSVQGTKGSGDGGIDIIVEVIGRTLWCQCKGHTKPVTVGTIREIAGVCSNKGVQPVVFAVNGYTRGARETATDLGVLLFDAPDIVSLAQQERLEFWL